MFCVDDDDRDDGGDDDLMITKKKGECFSTTGGIMRKRQRFRENIVLLSRLSKQENEFSETQSPLYSRSVREAFPKILERETYLNSSAVISIICFVHDLCFRRNKNKRPLMMLTTMIKAHHSRRC